MEAKLYLVGTPIGNLKDITYRAVETLKEVDYIACEDTRHSQILLNFYDIKKPLFSLHKFNEKKESEKVISLLKNQKSVAYISDAGMPSVSDPGYVLLTLVKEQNLPVEIIPGVTALTTALVGSGLETEKFCFLGFLPEQKKERENLLSTYKSLDCTLIFYSSSHNVLSDLKNMAQILGNRNCVVANELTKKFEKFLSGKLLDLSFEPKGEYVLLVAGSSEQSPLNSLSLDEHFDFYIQQNYSKMDAIKQVAKDRKLKKDEVYKHFIKKG